MELNSFPNSLPVELKGINQLIYKAKFEEALNLIEIFEKKGRKASKDELSCLILQGRIYCHTGRYKLAIKVGELVYQLSQKLGCIVESIDAFIIKAHIIYLGNIDEAFNLIIEAERLFKSITSVPSSRLSRQRSEILLLKSIIYHNKGELNEAIDLAKQCLTITEKYGEKLDIARIYYHLGELYLFRSESNIGLDYAMKGLTVQEELNNQTGIAECEYLAGASYYTKGDVDQALTHVKKSLTNKEINSLTKFNALDLLASIYINKGELDRALRFRTRAAKLAKKEDFNEQVIISTYGIGVIYRVKGESDLAIQYLKQSLELSEKVSSLYGIQVSLFYLILTNLDINSLQQAKLYLNQLEHFANKTESQVFNNIYTAAKALVLKKSGRIRNRTEAEILLKQITESEYTAPPIYLLSMVNLCELFLEELLITNNPEVLDDLVPLIAKMVKFAEKQQAYLWLAETRLLQAKLALIQMKIEDAKQILTQAQRVAELHGLNLLAVKISVEHDNLLERINVWDNLKKSNAPMSDRIKLASFDEPIERMQGKRAIELPKLIPEEPVLLLIIGEGGFPLFSTQFGKQFTSKEDLISGFLTAFDNFSSELFSKGLDRAKIGDHMILMQAAGKFSVCYLFKGQTYLAKRKLSKFTERIQNTTYIWETLNKFYDTNQIVELNKHPPLELLISEIFISIHH
ncbi:MAG: tetratricopeptide repeat protein [Promethearchaeota archaeon]|jgi:tetratricopeptide (TPR) repeat protein